MPSSREPSPRRTPREAMRRMSGSLRRSFSSSPRRDHTKPPTIAQQPHHPLFPLCFPNVVVTREYLKERRELVPAVYKKMLKKDDDLRKRHHKKEVTHMHKAQAALVRESYKN